MWFRLLLGSSCHLNVTGAPLFTSAMIALMFAVSSISPIFFVNMPASNIRWNTSECARVISRMAAILSLWLASLSEAILISWTLIVETRS